MKVRFNLIQRFVFLNLFWLAGMGIYFGYWFSDELIKTVTRLQSVDLADALQLDVNRRILLDDFDIPPTDPGAEDKTKSIEKQVSGILKPSEYRVQILWGRDRAIWSNRRNLIGTPLEVDPLLSEAFSGLDRAELVSSLSRLSWMWDAIAHGDRIVNDASSYVRILIPIRFSKEQAVLASAKLKSESLKKLISEAPEGAQIIPGVLELHRNARDILDNAVGTVKSIWKRVVVVTLLTFIILFSLFKSAFNTIERQGRQLREQERLSNLGKMASYLAHEIRNPLFIIRGSAQTIEETTDENDPPRKLSRYIIDEVDRLNNMVQDLLGLVKPRLAPSRDPTSLKQAIEDSRERSLKQAPKMTLVPQLDPAHDLIWFNRDQLVQVFTNLFRNARDACRGQGAILVESRATGDGNLQIRITDDGPGIPEADLPMIFEPFFSNKENGTGLGLAIVKHLVTRNNATIDAVTPAATGACFILTVRLAPEGAAEAGQDEAVQADNPAGGVLHDG
ncbi:MAG: Adaptive-response sensory-kinase SasA [bacterium]|nr:Adaptive-response sensory-kinase SasA [bacterium]